MYFDVDLKYSLKRLLISFVKIAKEQFIKHFGYDEYNFVEKNFSLCWFNSDLVMLQYGNKCHWCTNLTL